MSYALRLGDNAIAQLRTLDAGLQEDVLDELEAVATTPSLLRVDALSEAIQDFERHVGGMRHLIFIRLHRDDVGRVVTVLAIIDHRRP